MLKERQTKVPKEFEPVVVFVDECIKQKTEEGLQVLGLTGGYMDYDPEILTNPRTHLPSPPQSDIKMPYWWYEGGKSKFMPELGEIKIQLEKFIRSNATACLDNFRALESQFAVNSKREMDVMVSFNEEDVSVDVDYEIEAMSKLNDEKITLKNFYYNSNTRFRRAYELARAIMERQINGFFLERRTIDLMGLDREKYIPLDWFEFSCGTKKWKFSDAKTRLQELLRVNLPYVKVLGTDIDMKTFVPNPCASREFQSHRLCKREAGEPPINYDNTYESSYYSKHYLWEVDVNPGQKYRNMEVSFRYDNWPLQMEARPRDGPYLVSNAQKEAKLLKFFCMNVWKFTYDVSYSVMVSIFDRQTPKNKAYIFNFPFKVSIRSSQVDRQSSALSPFEESERISDDEYCKGDLQRAKTVVNTRDASGKGVAGVDIEFACGKFVCGMGKTEFVDPSETVARLEKQFPYCGAGGGIIRTSKEGYRENVTVGITTHNTPGPSININLIGLKSFGKFDENAGKWTSYKVYKIQLVKPQNQLFAKLADDNRDKYTFDISTKTDVADSPDMNAAITIQDTQSDYETYGVYPQETSEAALALIKNSDRNYKVAVYLVDKATNEPKGGFEGEWLVRRQDVQNKDDIELYAIDFFPNTELTAEEQEEERNAFLGNLEYFSGRLKDELMLQPALK